MKNMLRWIIVAAVVILGAWLAVADETLAAPSPHPACDGLWNALENACCRQSGPFGSFGCRTVMEEYLRKCGHPSQSLCSN